MANGFTPRFVRAELSFEFETRVYHAGPQLVNTFGAPGFRWTDFNPLSVIGKPAIVTAKLLTEKPEKLECTGYFSSEITTNSVSLGLTFHLMGPQNELLSAAIQKEGILPEYVRKFPRIAYNEAVSVMPSQSIVSFQTEKGPIVVVCAIDNLSPSGMQVYTEDPRVVGLIPDDFLVLEIQPRGTFSNRVSLKGQIRRIIQTINPASGNYRWYFGLSIVSISDQSKTTFTDLLRLILAQITKNKAAA